MIKIQKKNQANGQCILNPLGLLISESIVKTLKHGEKLIFCPKNGSKRPENGPKISWFGMVWLGCDPGSWLNLKLCSNCPK